MSLRPPHLLALAALLASCGHADAPCTGPECVKPKEIECGEREVPSATGGCEAVGVDDCGDGFEPDGQGGCLPRLPAAPCPAGTMAVPGELACRPIAPCSDARFPATSGPTQYVDGSVAAEGDGTMAAPWKTLGRALKAASPGDTLAVAKGRYNETLTIEKAVQLTGVCAERVEVHGGDVAAKSFAVSALAPTELRGLAITGPYGGVLGVTTTILTDGVWLHAIGYRAVSLSPSGGGSTLTMKNTLVEDIGEHGLFVVGSDAIVERSVVRGVGVTSGPASGLFVKLSTTSKRAGHATATASVFGDHGGTPIGVGADGHVTLRRTVVRNGVESSTSPIVTGAGINDGGELDAEQCVFSGNQDNGVQVLSGGRATLRRTTVVDVLPGGKGAFAVALSGHTGGLLTVDQCFFARGQVNTVFIAGATLSMQRSIVRDTRWFESGAVGVVIFNENDGTAGHASIGATLITRNALAGVMVAGSDARLERCIVSATAPDPRSGKFGDGIMMGMRHDSVTPPTLEILGSRIAHNARAGAYISVGTLRVGATRFSCNAFDMASEPIGGQPATVVDLAGNACSCGEVTKACRAESTGLEPISLDTATP